MRTTCTGFLVNRDDIRLFVAVLVQIRIAMLLKEQMRRVLVVVALEVSGARQVDIQPHPGKLPLLDVLRIEEHLMRDGRRLIQ
jgi:hypothetical protein